MPDHDLQSLAELAHDLAQAQLDQGACPACLAQAMVAEGCFLAQSFGALDLAKEIASGYTDDSRSLRQH